MSEFADYFVSFEPVKSRWSAEGVDREKLKPFMSEILSHENWKAGELEEAARSWIGSHEGAKMKDYAMPLRFALTGMKVSPGIFEVAELMGREECRKRLEYFGLI